MWHRFGTPITLCLALVSSTALSQVSPATAPVAIESKLASDTGKTIQSPVFATGHGTLFSSDGRALTPSVELLEKTMEFYLGQLASDEKSQELVKTLGDQVTELQKKLDIDDLLTQSILLDLTLKETKHRDTVRIASVNTALRRAYFKEILKADPAELKLNYNTGWPADIFSQLQDIGGLTVFSITEEQDEGYIRECRDAGVPIPPNRWVGRNNPGQGDFDRGLWKFEGEQTLNFASSAPLSHVYSYDTANISGEPDGLCMALPRITGSNIGLLGIICLGRETSKACFWDNNNIGIDEEVGFSEWLGGVALQGAEACSDCHAGESPFVVHPGTSIELGNSQKSPEWYEPLVVAGWPQNPGPTELLNYIPLAPDERSCQGCHTQSNAGRLPEVGSLPMYCSTVLNPALMQTMPPGNVGDSAYDKHAEALRAFCSQPPPDGTNIPNDYKENDPEVISSPIVPTPYACATIVEVRGVKYGANLTLFIDGVQVAQQIVSRPSDEMIDVPALVAGQKVVAVQEKDGSISAPSEPVIVRDYLEDYPNGLPRPEIDPTRIHECGLTIAVRHVRGATVTVYTNDTDPAKYVTGGDWTNLPPAIRPFELGDRYTAEQSLCGDPPGPLSIQRAAIAPPMPMPEPESIPASVYPGQELVEVSNLAHGALTEVTIDPGGASTSFSTAIDRRPEIDIAQANGGPLSGSVVLVVTSKLCETVANKFPVNNECSTLPAPVIAPPFAGNRFVEVLSAVPGANIAIYDNSGNELGDSAGTVISLNREIQPGDVLNAVQRVGDCLSSNAYRIGAMCTNNNQGCG